MGFYDKMVKYSDLTKRHLDLSCLGFAQSDREEAYYCTPKGARILGWAGVDGIHYCTIRGFGDLIFAVNPMDFGSCVHPIAKNLEDLLRLLLSCADMAALEQCYAWDREQFNQFLADNPPTTQQQAALRSIRDALGLTPMEDAFGYIKKLQAGFDLTKIPYQSVDSKGDDCAKAAQSPASREVYFGAGFWGKKGRAGKKIAIERQFAWGNETWHVPCAYLCAEGLVVDFCIEVDPRRVEAFYKKWNPAREEDADLTLAQRDQRDAENPLQTSFRAHLRCNGKPLRQKTTYCLTWVPQSLLPQGEANPQEARDLLNAYALDDTRAWSFCRANFLWATKRKPAVNRLTLKLERHPDPFAAGTLRNPAAGDVIPLRHPLSGALYTLKILDCQPQQIQSAQAEHDPYQYPTYCTALSYSLEPDLSARCFRLQDRLESDAPKQRTKFTYLPHATGDCFTVCVPRKEDPTAQVCEGVNQDAPAAQSSESAGAIAIIGGADGPAVVTAFLATARQNTAHTVFSSLHFEPAARIDWEMCFYAKRLQDKEVALL